MDDNVVQLDAFKKRSENSEVNTASSSDTKPHIQGNATCLSCRHDWQVVAEAGETCFTCPECGLTKGVMNQVIAPEIYWECGSCQNAFFMVSPDGCVCSCCGTLQNF